MSDLNCLFCKICAGEITSRIVYEDEEIFSFEDIHPHAPVHFLMVPRLHIASMAQLEPRHAGLLGRMMVLAPQLALQQGARPYPDGGFRVMVNSGDEGGQEIHHLHLHVLAGARPWRKG